MADSPAVVLYGQVTGYFTDLLADSTDAGFQPDMSTLEGTITLEAVDLKFMKFSTTSPKMMALIRPIVLRVLNGQVMGPGTTPEAYILATTQPSGQPSSFYWRATFNLTGVPVQPATVTFQLAPGAIVDLSQAIASTPQPGVIYVVESSSLFVKTINGVGPDAAGNVVVTGTGGGGGGGTGTAESTTPTPNTLAKRDAEGQMQAADPVAAQDVVTKKYQEDTVGAAVVTLGQNMDNMFQTVSGHTTDIASLDSRMDNLEASSSPVSGIVADAASIPAGAAVGSLWVVTE